MNDHLSIDENKEHKQQINNALLKVGNHKLTCMAIILQYLHRLFFLYYHSTSNIILYSNVKKMNSLQGYFNSSFF